VKNVKPSGYPLKAKNNNKPTTMNIINITIIAPVLELSF
jgi:hypothetical protein